MKFVAGDWPAGERRLGGWDKDHASHFGEGFGVDGPSRPANAPERHAGRVKSLTRTMSVACTGRSSDSSTTASQAIIFYADRVLVALRLSAFAEPRRSREAR